MQSAPAGSALVKSKPALPLKPYVRDGRHVLVGSFWRSSSEVALRASIRTIVMSTRNNDPHGINAAWKQLHADRRTAEKRCRTAAERQAVAKRFAADKARLIASVKAKKRQRRRDIPRWKKGVPFNVWYPIYLKSPHWQRTRKAALKRAGHKCEECGVGGVLQVHHLTYVNLRQELPEDLRVLCRGCHEHAHGLDQRDSITVEFLRLNLDRN